MYRKADASDVDEITGDHSVDLYVIDQLLIKYFYLLAIEEKVAIRFNST